jgi:hypothetical protein
VLKRLGHANRLAHHAPERRARRAEDVRRCRERQRRGVILCSVEVGEEIFDLMIRFGGLREGDAGDRQAVSDALERLLSRALGALLREGARR